MTHQDHIIYEAQRIWYYWSRGYLVNYKSWQDAGWLGVEQ